MFHFRAGEIRAEVEFNIAFWIDPLQTVLPADAEDEPRAFFL